VHGGVAIVTGCSYVTNGALFSFFGAGVHQFVGGGVLVNTGKAVSGSENLILI
jgi:TM2 domain-containing membrane protein YozV